MAKRGQHYLTDIIDNWNERYPVGTAVILKRGNQDFHTRTTTVAEVVLDTPMIGVEGLTGMFDLDKVKAI